MPQAGGCRLPKWIRIFIGTHRKFSVVLGVEKFLKQLEICQVETRDWARIFLHVRFVAKIVVEPSAISVIFSTVNETDRPAGHPAIHPAIPREDVRTVD
jgi:hypothetical protein